MQPRDPGSNDTRPKSYIVLTPATVGVICLVVVALAVAFKFLPDAKPPAPVAPAYPDLSARVAELEQQLAAAKSAAPAWPDLSGKVATLESAQAGLQRQLAEAQAAPEYTALRHQIAALESELEATRDALAVAQDDDREVRLRLERDDLAGRAARLAREVAQLRTDRERMQKLLAETGRQMRAASAQKTTLNEREAAYAFVLEELQTTRTALATAQDEAGRVREELAALEHSARLTLAEAATDRTRLEQLRSANATLTRDNQRLQSALARGTVAAPASAPAPAPVALSASRTHVVTTGDSLSNLSARYYGTAERWREIYRANADLLGPTGTLRIGTTLRIP